MRSVSKLTLVLAMAVLTADVAGADCISNIARISFRGINPNRTASATAWTGALFGATKVVRSSQNQIYFATYNEELARLTDDRLVAQSSLNGPIVLLWNGLEFGLFYLTESAQLTLQRISASGGVLGAPVAVAPQHAPARDREYEIVWDPAHQAYVLVFTVAIGTSRGIHVSLISREGVERSTLYLSTIIASPARPQVAVTSDGTIAVAYHAPGTDAVRFVTLDQALQIIASPLSLAAAREIELAPDGANFVVVGTNQLTPTEIRWMTLTRTGSVVRSEIPLLNMAADVAPLQLSWNTDLQEWALLYVDSFYTAESSPGQLRLLRFTAAGVRLSDAPFSPDYLTSTYTGAYPISWSGKTYLGSIVLDQSTQGTDSFLVRHCPLVVTPTASSRFVKPGELVTFTAETSGGTPQYSHTWNFGDTPFTDFGPSLSHRYEKNGTYTVTVHVVDFVGGTSTGTMTIEVKTGKRRAASR